MRRSFFSLAFLFTFSNLSYGELTDSTYLAIARNTLEVETVQSLEQKWVERGGEIESFRRLYLAYLITASGAVVDTAVQARDIQAAVVRLNDVGYSFDWRGVTEENVLLWRKEALELSMLAPRKPVVSKPAIQVKLPKPPAISLPKVEFLIIREGVFARDEEQHFLLHKGVPVRIDKGVGSALLKKDPAKFPLLNKAREFSFHPTERVALDLSAPVHTEQDFQLMVHLLVQSEVGRSMLMSLMNVDGTSSIRTHPLSPYEGEFRLQGVPVESIVADFRVLSQNSKIRPEAKVRIQENEDGSFTIYFKKGEELGILIAELFLAIKTDSVAGVRTLDPSIWEWDQTDYNFPKRRLELMNSCKVSLGEVPAGEKLLREGILEKFNDTCWKLFEAERAYQTGRLGYLLHSGMQTASAFFDEIFRRLSELEEPVEPLLDYYKSREAAHAIAGVTMPLELVTVLEAFGLNPEFLDIGPTARFIPGGCPQLILGRVLDSELYIEGQPAGRRVSSTNGPSQEFETAEIDD